MRCRHAKSKRLAILDLDWSSSTSSSSVIQGWVWEIGMYHRNKVPVARVQWVAHFLTLTIFSFINHYWNLIVCPHPFRALHASLFRAMHVPTCGSHLTCIIPERLLPKALLSSTQYISICCFTTNEYCFNIYLATFFILANRLSYVGRNKVQTELLVYSIQKAFESYSIICNCQILYLQMLFYCMD